MAMTKKAEKWPIPFNSETARTTYARVVKSLEGHPNVSVPVDVDYMIDKELAVTIRPWAAKGSLKDFIHKVSILFHSGPYLFITGKTYNKICGEIPE